MYGILNLFSILYVFLPMVHCSCRNTNLHFTLGYLIKHFTGQLIHVHVVVCNVVFLNIYPTISKQIYHKHKNKTSLSLLKILTFYNPSKQPHYKDVIVSVTCPQL